MISAERMRSLEQVGINVDHNNRIARLERDLELTKAQLDHLRQEVDRLSRLNSPAPT